MNSKNDNLEKTSDVEFINPLHGVSNEEASGVANFLFFTIIITVISLLIWANIAKVDEFTSGDGKVIPSSKIQIVQYFDTGIISDILIKEGVAVRKGDSLLKIDTTRFKASFEETEENILALKTAKIRLEKELTTNYKGHFSKLKYPKKLEQQAKQYINNQQKIYKNKFFERKNSLKIIKLQYKQKKQELVEIRSKVKQLKRTLKYIKKEYAIIEKMVKSGSKSKVELLNIQKEYNNLKGSLDAASLSIPRTKLSIQESSAQIEEKLQFFKSEISLELQEKISDIKKLEARFVTDSDRLEKTIIKSPVDGIVKQININTIGGVIRSGEDLIEIVPDSEILLIEAKIDPKDIAFINPSLKVRVKLTAYDFSIYGGLEGKIIEISADSIKDIESRDGKSFYKIVVKTDKNYLEHNGEKLIIIPGMIAKVDIVTGKKTIIDFFLKPILKVKEGSLHER